MATPENLQETHKGVEIDEGFSLVDGRVFIDVSIYDENDRLIFYDDYPRNISPTEISQKLITFARELEESPPGHMEPQDVKKMADSLKASARKVPGLKHEH